MSKQSENLRDQAWRARRLSQTVSDGPSSKSLCAIAQKYEDDANRLEMTDCSAPGQKTHPPDGWISVALSEIESGLKSDGAGSDSRNDQRNEAFVDTRARPRQE